MSEGELTQADVDQASLAVFMTVTRNSMLFALRHKYRFYKGGENTCSFLSFFSIVLSIIALSTQDMPTSIEVLLIAYVVLVGLSEIVIVLGFLLLCLIPLLLVGCLICFCCCRQKGEGDYVDLPSKKATRQDLVQAKGDCPICFQALAIDERIYVLPCSPMHVFHCGCLEKWSAVRNTCPVCRHKIPMTDRKRPQRDEE